MIRYSKMKDDSWGVIGPVDEITEGPVVVTRKDGSEREEYVTGSSRPFADRETGEMLCFGYLKPKGEEAAAPKQTKRGNGGTSKQASVAAAPAPASEQMCDACGTRPATITAFDKKGQQGTVCPPCAILRRTERDFVPF